MNGGKNIMKKFLKYIVAIFTVIIGFLLGIYLLDGLAIWRVALFLLVCWGMGHVVYYILRVIDKRYEN